MLRPLPLGTWRAAGVTETLVMASDAPVPSAPVPSPGLPPVAPPSGRFIVQLFLVPGLIVAVAVLILLGFRYLVSGTQTPEAFLRKLDDPNPEVRWRGASELAQVLQRPESRALASDPKFGLDLADRLRRALEDMRSEERATSGKGEQWAWYVHAPQRRYALFLAACLGDMIVPVGAPLLCDMATNDRGSDPKWKALRRRRAVWALANLGNNRHRFQKELSTAEKEAVIARLQREADGTGERAKWAAATLASLEGKALLRVDKALAECAADEGDPFLRELVAFALKYWDGPEVGKTLVRLAHDHGEGEAVEIDEKD